MVEADFLLVIRMALAGASTERRSLRTFRADSTGLNRVCRVGETQPSPHKPCHTGNTLAASSGSSLKDLMSRMDHDSTAGTAAAAPTVARKRAALFSTLQYAVELELLPNNPLEHVKLRRPIIAEAVDRRVVVNPAQAKTLLCAVRSAYPALEAYFACLYYAALRPAEARHLRVKDCRLPNVGWGELVLLGSTPQASSAWTDSGQAN